MQNARPSTADLLGIAPVSPANQAVASASPANTPKPSGVGDADASLASRLRNTTAFTGSAYDGASRFAREVAMWRPSSRSADGDLLPNKKLADARARDAVRNDAFISGALRMHQDNIVGAAFLLNAKPDWETLNETETWAAEFQKEVENKFTLWAESPNNWPDASRKGTLTDLVRLAVASFVQSGEVLASVEWIRYGARPFRTALQVLDPDRLSNPMYEADTTQVRGGIKRDQYGAPLGYYIRVSHPSDYLTNGDSLDWKYVPARKPWGRPQIIHIFDMMRPDQSRGISDLVAALKELKITKDFRDIVLQNAVINATFAASIESDLPAATIFEALGGGKENNEALTQYAQEMLGAASEWAAAGKNMHLNGARIPHLFPGTKLNMHHAGQGGPLGTEFEASLLRYLAAALGVSYEQLSRDYSQTNYSSARAAMNETWKFMQSRKKMVADRLASIIYRLWIEEAMNTGQLDTLKGKQDKFYTGGALNMMFEALTACDWIGASRGQIDELKETQAAVLRLKYNLTTQEDELARLGKDWRRVNAQREREQKDQIARGLAVDPKDDAINAASGTPQQREKSDEPADSSGDVDAIGTARDLNTFDAAPEPVAGEEDATDD